MRKNIYFQFTLIIIYRFPKDNGILMINPKELAIKANNLRKEKNYKEALGFYKQSWDILKDAYTGAGLLHCLRKLENFEQAIPFAESLINLFPTIDWVKIEVAWTLVSGPFKRVNSFNNALIVAEKIDKITSNHIILKKIAFKLVKLADNHENWETAFKWLKKVNPEDLSEDFIKNTKWSDKSRWQYNYNKTLLKIEKYDELISNIDKSIDEFSQIKEFFLNLKAKAFKMLEKYDDSVIIYEELMKYKSDWWIYKDYADLLIKMDNKNFALKMFYQAASLNKSVKMMVNVYYRIGRLCNEMGKEKEALCHYILCKLIREKEGWAVPEDLEESIFQLSDSFPEISQIKSIKNIFLRCQDIWEVEGPKIIKIQKRKKSITKIFKGTLKLGRQNQPFCFINTEKESIICNKSILPSNIKDNDKVKCEAIPSYNKKKQRESWKAIKVEKV